MTHGYNIILRPKVCYRVNKPTMILVEKRLSYLLSVICRKLQIMWQFTNWFSIKCKIDLGNGFLVPSNIENNVSHIILAWIVTILGHFFVPIATILNLLVEATRGRWQFVCVGFWNSGVHTYPHDKFQKVVTKCTMVPNQTEFPLR